MYPMGAQRETRERGTQHVPANNKSPSRRPGLTISYGGEGGIRTHGGLHLAGFQDQSLKPLDHLSESTIWIIIKKLVSVNSRTGNAFIALR